MKCVVRMSGRIFFGSVGFSDVVRGVEYWGCFIAHSDGNYDMFVYWEGNFFFEIKTAGALLGNIKGSKWYTRH